MGNIGRFSIKWFRSSFTQQGFKNEAVKRWKSRKKKKTGKILFKTGALAASGRVTSTSSQRVVMAFTVPYAGFHNVGGKKLPKRQFIGDSVGLNRVNLRIILAQVHLIMK